MEEADLSDIPLPLFLNLIDMLPFLLVGLGLLVLLMLSALISTTEASFFSLKQADIQECKDSKKIADKHIVALLAYPQQLLATVLILNNFVNIAFITLSTYSVWTIVGTHDLGGTLITLLTLLVSLALILFGEIIPKIYAAQNALRSVRILATPLYFLNIMLRPLTALFLVIHQWIDKRIERKGYTYSKDTLKQALHITTQKTSSQEEKGMLYGIASLTSTHIKEVMQARINITALDVHADFTTLIKHINHTRYSRIPVYKGDMDKIVGILYVKDLLPHIDNSKNDKHFDWQRLLRAPFFVPENKKIGALFKDFQKKHVHIAVVVDEYGGTSGLITMEDVIEEIIGDIRDESDTKADDILYKKIDANTYIFEGKISLNDFSKIIHVDNSRLEEVRGSSHSLAGLLLELHGTIPKIGEKIVLDPFVFTAVAVDEKKIKRVRVLVSPQG